MPLYPGNNHRPNTSTTASPKWRTPSTSKKRAPTTVSLVFGQPEQGAPLGSAIEKLPIVMLDDAVSLSSYRSGVSLGERGSVNSLAAGEDNERAAAVDAGVIQVREEMQSAEQDVIATAIEDRPSFSEPPSADASTSEVLHPPAAKLTSVEYEPPKGQSPASSNKSWFGSFTRSGGRGATLKSQSSSSLRVELLPTDVQAETTSVPASSLVNETLSQSSNVPEIHVLPPLEDAVDEQMSTSPDCAITNPDELNSDPNSKSANNNATSMTCVGDEQPKSTSTPVEVPHDGPSVSLRPEERAQIPLLTPSTSRFTLRIPLLGRPKVPLDQAVVVAQIEDIRKIPADDNYSPGHDDKTNAAIESLSEQADQAQSVTVATVEDAVEPVVWTEESMQRETMGSSTSSWWDYVGWGSSTSIRSAPAAIESLATTDNIAGPSHSTNTTTEAQSTPSLPLESSSLPAHALAPEISRPEVNSQDTRDRADEVTPSLRSTETSKSLSSAWYAPWTWYPASGVAIVSQNPAAESSQTDPHQSRTESELVKEEALARNNQEYTSDNLPSPKPPILFQNLDVTNPVQSIFADHRSGWASFFMSRSVKSITEAGERQEEDGMEVMTIDVEDAPVSPSSASLKSATLNEYDHRQPQHRQRQQSPQRPSSSKTFSMDNKEPKYNESLPTADRQVQSSPTLPAGRTGTVSPILSRPPPNLVLPTWNDTFHAPPRSLYSAPQAPSTTITKTLKFVAGLLSSRDSGSTSSRKGKDKSGDFLHFGKELPRALDVIGEKVDPVLLNGQCKVAVIGIAGWSPGAVTRTIAGGLPSSSSKFVTMTCQALERFEETQGVKFKKITKIALEGDGTVARKVDKVYQHLLTNKEWVDAVHDADVIFVAAHSQGSIVAAHLIDSLIQDGHIRTSYTAAKPLAEAAAAIAPGGTVSSQPLPPQKICCLCLCGIHLGPLRYLKMSSFIQPYIQYFENAAAREIFEFQNTNNTVSRNYVRALKNVMRHGTKMVYVASLNDQVVPIYSGLFTAASHPHILRALYIDGDAYHSSDFLSNLLVLLLRILNSGFSDSGLLTHLSEATAGSLSGVGHSSAYEEPAAFSLAVNYQFLTNDGDGEGCELAVEAFNAVTEQNDYEIPWSLRDLIANERVAHFFSREFVSLRDAFGDWQPKTTILRDIKRKLQPIQRLSNISSSPSGSNSYASLSASPSVPLVAPSPLSM